MIWNQIIQLGDPINVLSDAAVQQAVGSPGAVRQLNQITEQVSMPGNNHSLVKESLWHTPHACTLIRTCLAPGSGVSFSTISKGPFGLEIWIARIYPL
jgi:hypothetical protein